jgi:ankyrin repeat protein
MQTKRNLTAQSLHNLIFSYIYGNFYRLSSQTCEHLKLCGLKSSVQKDGVTIELLKQFVRLAPEKLNSPLNDWAADVNNEHSEFSSILLIPFRERDDAGVFKPVADLEKARSQCKELLTLYEKEIFPKLSQNNKNTLLTYPSEAGYIPLQGAIKTGDKDIIERVIKLLKLHAPEQLAAQLTHANKAGFTPLLDAIGTGDKDIIERVIKLLELHAPEQLVAQLTQVNTSGFTPFNHAIKVGDKNTINYIVELLKEYAPDQLAAQLTPVNRAGYTPLLNAIARVDKDIINHIVELLKEYAPKQLAAQLTQVNISGFTPLNHAIRVGDKDIIKQVVELIKLNAPDQLEAQLTNANEAGYTPLLDAIEKGDKDIIKQVVELIKLYVPDQLEVQLTRANEAGFTPLLGAIEKGDKDNIEQVIKLLKLHAPGQLAAQLTHENNAGYTPLQGAIKMGDVEVVKKLDYLMWELVENKALSQKDYNALWHHKNNHNFNLLQSAVGSLNPKMIDFVLDKIATTYTDVGSHESRLMSGRYHDNYKGLLRNHMIFKSWSIAIFIKLKQNGNDLDPKTIENALQSYDRICREYANLHQESLLEEPRVPDAFKELINIQLSEGQAPAQIYEVLCEAWSEEHCGREWPGKQDTLAWKAAPAIGR